MALLLAVRPIDLAIFFTLGTLWVFGAGFIVVLYRWILRFEAETGDPDVLAPEPATPEPTIATLRPARAKDFGGSRQPAGQRA